MIDKLPLVSVIVPTFNSGKFIKSALDSIFRQNYPMDKIEIIIIDDGSTDETLDIIKSYGDRVVYTYQENKGIASARNKGISMAEGEIITFLDGDDEWHEERIQKVVEKFISNPQVGIVYHPVALIDRNGEVIHRNFYRAFGYVEGLSGWIADQIFSGRVFCGGSSFSFRRSITERVCPVPEGIRRGIDFYMAAIASCISQAEYIPEILGKYRMHDKNTTMMIGRENKAQLASLNYDFAFMREKVIEEITGLNNTNLKDKDINVLKRIQAKEIIFYNVLDNRRGHAIRLIPSLFRGHMSVKDFVRGITVSFMALFVPSFLYPFLVRMYGSFTGLKSGSSA